MELREAREVDRTVWDAFVAERPEGDPLQAWAWGEVVAPTSERSVRLILTDADGRVRGLAQALVRSTTFGRSVAYVPHGPVWERDAPDGPAVLAALLDGLRGLARAERSIVVKLDPRGRPGEPDVAPALLAAGLRRARWDLQAPTTRIVELLDGGEALWSTWNADARRLARRAAREGVVVRIHRTADEEAIVAFHRLLATTASRSDFRARSEAFVARLARAFTAPSPSLPSGGWYLALAVLDGRPIAGMAVPRVGDRAFYLYGASLREEALKHKYGAYAAMAGLMAALAQDGARTLDLWGVVERDDRRGDSGWEGFSAFKRTFGGRPVQHPGTFDLVADPVWYAIRDLRERIRGARPA